MYSCKNCHAAASGNYCANCGQKINEEKISFSFIWKGLLHFFTHTETGFLYTTRQLIRKPGPVSINYIDGIRIRYQSPVSYFLIWIMVYILLLYICSAIFGENKAIDFSGYFGEGDKTKLAVSYLNFVLLALLPFQAVYVWGILMRKQYNFFESFVVVLYSIGTLILWQCVFVVLAVFIHLLSGAALNIRYSDIFKVVYVSWFLYDFARHLKIKNKWLRALLTLILIGITFIVWRLFVYPAVAELFL